jgi:hypothetical protein
MHHDPSEWLDDYWQRVQYDQDLIQEANLELTMLRSPIEEGI